MFSNDGKSIHHVKNATNAYLWSLADTTHSSGCWWKFSSIFTLIFSSIFVLFFVHACALTIPFNLIDDFSYSEKAWQCHQSIYSGGVYVGQHICQYIHTFRLSTVNMHTHFSRIHNHSLAHTIYLSTCISRGASDQNSSIIYYNAHGFSTPRPLHTLCHGVLYCQFFNIQYSKNFISINYIECIGECLMLRCTLRTTHMKSSLSANVWIWLWFRFRSVSCP